MNEELLVSYLMLGRQMERYKTLRNYSIRKLEGDLLGTGHSCYYSIGYYEDHTHHWHEATTCLDPQMAESLRAFWSRCFRLEAEQEYVLRMPASEAMIHCGKHGHLQRLKITSHRAERSDGSFYVYFRVLFPSETSDTWYAPGYTYSEVGLYERKGNLYGELPDLSENPEEIQESVKQIQHDLNEILTKAGATTIDVDPFK